LVQPQLDFIQFNDSLIDLLLKFLLLLDAIYKINKTINQEKCPKAAKYIKPNCLVESGFYGKNEAGSFFPFTVIIASINLERVISRGKIGKFNNPA